MLQLCVRERAESVKSSPGLLHPNTIIRLRIIAAAYLTPPPSPTRTDAHNSVISAQLPPHANADFFSFCTVVVLTCATVSVKRLKPASMSETVTECFSPAVH
jgi:hypothetical protein